MQLISLGGPAIKIISKTNLVPEGELSIVINPYGTIKGLPKLRKQKAHVVVASKDTSEYYDAKNVDKEAFVINAPGEYEIKGALFNSLFSGTGDKGALVFRIDLENVEIGFCLGVGEVDMDSLTKALEGIDVLCVPVGGKEVLDAKKAMEVTTALEPRLVIPMQYKSKSSPVALDTVAGFVKEFGGSAPAVVSKYRLTRKELPTADRQLLLLE